MFKLFKTKEERDLAFVSKLWERPKRTDKLKEALSYVILKLLMRLKLIYLTQS